MYSTSQNPTLCKALQHQKSLRLQTKMHNDSFVSSISSLNLDFIDEDDNTNDNEDEDEDAMEEEEEEEQPDSNNHEEERQQQEQTPEQEGMDAEITEKELSQSLLDVVLTDANNHDENKNENSIVISSEEAPPPEAAPEKKKRRKKRTPKFATEDFDDCYELGHEVRVIEQQLGRQE